MDIDPTHSPDPGDPDVDFEPEHDEPDLDESGDDPDEGEVGADAPTPAMGGGDMPPIPRPINWRTLSSDDAEHEWLALNEWVNWLRHEFALPAQIIPPMWHRHPELVWELSALHTLHQMSFDPADTGYGPIGFHERLTPAVTRLARAGSGCATAHIDLKPRAWPSRPGADWDAWITQTHASGDTPVPPEEERKK